ncbi:hypothetical protein ACTFIR_003791 [Dictyostelium discoideum]
MNGNRKIHDIKPFIEEDFVVDDICRTIDKRYDKELHEELKSFVEILQDDWIITELGSNNSEGSYMRSTKSTHVESYTDSDEDSNSDSEIVSTNKQKKIDNFKKKFQDLEQISGTTEDQQQKKHKK